MNPAQPPVISTPARRRLAVFFKIAGICVLIALLHIPLAMTHGVLRERQSFQTQATEEIAGLWGRQQIVTGPVLAVPYVYKAWVTHAKVVGEKVVQVGDWELTPATAYFLPEMLAVNGKVEPEVRHRGIYDTVVYSTKLKLAGFFQPDFIAAGIRAERIDWSRAQLLFGVSDVHGVRAVGPLRSADGREAVFESVTDALLPLAAKVTGANQGERQEFNFDATVQGSGQLKIAPVGKNTTVALQSPWPAPSFTGAALPVARTVGADGFTAEWQSAHFSRGFAQSWTDRLAKSPEVLGRITTAGFGVNFLQPVDAYSVVERAQKYGVLFFVLVFTVCFLFEVTAALRIHPLQYALVGAALCLFFLGFLALAEFWPTAWAYGAAAGACTLLVTAYAWNFLKTGRRTLVIGGGLAATYGYLYFVLKSQDFALIAGTAALFAALALVMFCTRRINWYELELAGTGKVAPAKP
jgi:inner membrane protein